MLEDEIKRFRLGKKIANEAFYDYLNSTNPKYSPKIHQTRVEGIGSRDSLESLGYLAAMLRNTVKHPVKMYKVLILNKS